METEASASTGQGGRQTGPVGARATNAASEGDTGSSLLPSVSVVVPAYNEAVIIADSLNQLCDYLSSLSAGYWWEIVVVDDGSTDGTGEIAEGVAARHPQVRVLHHATNFNLGRALRSGFSVCQGDFVVTMDCDLSYGPEHIGRLLEALRGQRAEIAIASPYMKGGRTSGVPPVRRLMSKGANRFLSIAAKGDLSTLTGMVRGYDRVFLASLDLKATGTDINTEILYKAQLLGARIVEVPAHLDWSRQGQLPRRSSIRMGQSTSGYLLAGFLFRPMLFFVGPSLVVLAIGLLECGVIVWRAGNGFAAARGSLDARLSAAINHSWQAGPPAWILAGACLILATQLLVAGVLASQSKRYFEDLFGLGTMLNRRIAHSDGASPPGSGPPGGADQDR